MPEHFIKFGNLDSIDELQLDPPKGANSQAALISLTGVIDADTYSDAQIVKPLVVDDIQLLSPAEAEALKPIILKMFCFAALSGQLSQKREHGLWRPDK